MEAILVPEDVQGGSLNDEQSGQSLRSAMRRTLGSIVGISDRGLFPSCRERAMMTIARRAIVYQRPFFGMGYLQKSLKP